MMLAARPKYRRNINRAFRGLPEMDPLSLGCIFSMCGEGGDAFAFDGSGNGNHGSVQGNPVHKFFPEIGEWGYDLDGTGDFLAIQNFSDGWITPAGGGQAANWTNTGLCHDTTDKCFWIGDFTNSRAVKVSLSGEYITSFALGFQPQGLAYDSSDDTLWISNTSSNRVEHWNKSGSEISVNDRLILGSGNSPNGCSYEAATDTLWVANNAGSFAPIVQLDCTAGSNTVTQTPLVSLTPTPTGMDGCHYEASDDTLWVSSDLDNKVYNISSADGSTISSFGPLDDVEDLVIIGGLLHINLDMTQHSSTARGNRVHTFDLSGNRISHWIKKEFAITMWVRPATTMTNNGIVCIRQNSNYKFSLNLGSSSQPRLQVSTGSAVTSQPAYAITDTTKWFPLGINYNGATIKVYADGLEKGSAAQSGNLTNLSLAEFWIGGYFATANLFNGDIAGMRVYDRPLSASEFAQAAVPNRRPVERRRTLFVGESAGGTVLPALDEGMLVGGLQALSGGLG